MVSTSQLLLYLFTQTTPRSERHGHTHFPSNSLRATKARLTILSSIPLTIQFNILSHRKRHASACDRSLTSRSRRVGRVRSAIRHSGISTSSLATATTITNSPRRPLSDQRGPLYRGRSHRSVRNSPLLQVRRLPLGLLCHPTAHVVLLALLGPQSVTLAVCSRRPHRP